MKQTTFSLLLSLATASLNTGEESLQQISEVEASQEQVISYAFCWFLLVGVILIVLTFYVSRDTPDQTFTELKESLLPSHFYPRKGDCYYSAPKRGNEEFINNL